MKKYNKNFLDYTHDIRVFIDDSEKILRTICNLGIGTLIIYGSYKVYKQVKEDN